LESRGGSILESAKAPDEKGIETQKSSAKTSNETGLSVALDSPMRRGIETNKNEEHREP